MVNRLVSVGDSFQLPAAVVIAPATVAPAAAGMALGTAWQNTSSRTVALVVAVTLVDPGAGATTGVTWSVGPTSTTTTVGNDLLTGDADVAVASQRILHTFIVPPGWYAKAVTTGSGVTLTTSTFYVI